MKSIKLLLMSLMIAPLLTNCSVNKETVATTPEPITTFCQQNPTHESCDDDGGEVITSETRRTMTGYYDMSSPDAYEDMLKGIFGFCDHVYINYNGNIWDTIISSVIPTSANRCSKWNKRGALRMQFTGDGRVSLQAFAISNYGEFFEEQTEQLFYIPFAEFISANNDQDKYIDLDRYANGARTGLIMYIEGGDIYNDNFEVSFEYHGEEMAKIRMYDDRLYN